MSLNLSAMGNAIACPNCQQPYQARVEQVIDVGRDASAKARFLSGQTNVGTCPKCGYRVGLATPLVYHDPDKELLLVYVPMEVGLQKQEQERLIGRLVKTVMDNTPAEKRRGYLFQPRTVLSMQGLIEAVLAADGVTPEMLEADRARLRLVETFLQADEEQIPALVAQHDDKIDMAFLEIISLAAENARQAGRADMAELALALRERLLTLSTVGKQAMADLELQEQAIQDVLARLEALGEQPAADDFMALVIDLADDDKHLQALVGMQYPVFDYGFFQALAARIEAAVGDEKARLEGLRTRLADLVNLIKKQQEAQAKAAAMVLGEIANSEDVEAAVRRHLPYLDDTFMMVLAANQKAAQDRNDLAAGARLSAVADAVRKVVQESIPPEVQFVSRLLQQESLDDARALVTAEAGQYGEALLPVMDALLADLDERGQQDLVHHVRTLRALAAEAVR